MASFNRVLLLGNLTRDPQMRYLPNQNPVTDFGLACNRNDKTASGEQREEVTFVDCAAFGRLAEIINQYCTKGKPILVEGRLKYDSWEDKNGGGKRNKLSVVVENMQLLGGRDGGAGGPGGPAAVGADEPPPARSASSPRPAAAQAPTYNNDEAPPVSNDDIPF